MASANRAGLGVDSFGPRQRERRADITCVERLGCHAREHLASSGAGGGDWLADLRAAPVAAERLLPGCLRTLRISL